MKFKQTKRTTGMGFNSFLSKFQGVETRKTILAKLSRGNYKFNRFEREFINRLWETEPTGDTNASR